VTFNGCARTQYVVGDVAGCLTVNVTSTHGVYGTPEFVARQALGVRIAG